jgi:hypothetical protein
MAGAQGLMTISGEIFEIEAAPAPEPRTDDFSMGLEELQVAVARGCAASSGPWAGRLAAGIRAALSFAASNPAAARTLIDSRATQQEADGDYRALIDRFSGQLRDCAPPDRRVPPSSEEAVVANIAGVVNGCLHSGSAGRLDEMAPYLVYLALLPYVGFDEAWRWSGSIE